MNIKNIIFIFSLILIFATCNKQDFFDEANPYTEIIQIPGYEFYLKGTLAGEAIEFKHLSKEEYNRPTGTDPTSSAHPKYGTLFANDPLEIEEPRYHISIGITKGRNDGLLDVVKEGSLSGWYGFHIPSDSRGEAFVQLGWEEKNMTSSIQPDTSSFNQFNITDIEMIDLDENLSEIYRDKIYKVTGNFQTYIFDWDDNDTNDTVKLIVDEFVGLFRDE